MTSFKSYNGFQLHEHAFNTLVSTAVAIGISVLVGNLFGLVTNYDSVGGYFLLWILIAIPIIVFVVCVLSSEDVIAYYRTWYDYCKGFVDKRKILRQFMKQYNIPSLRLSGQDFSADGRWSFHIDTEYIKLLNHKRDLLSSQLYQDYQDILGKLNKALIDADKALQDAEIEYNLSCSLRDNTLHLLKVAKTSGEVYVQRQQHHQALQDVSEKEEQVNECKHHISTIKDVIENLHAEYRETDYRLDRLFKKRHGHYADFAVRKINQVNNLKWDIAVPVNTDWTARPIRKVGL